MHKQQKKVGQAFQKITVVISVYLMYLCPSFIIVQVEEELAKEKDNTAKLENTVTDLTSQCTISLQQTEEFRKEVKEKVSVIHCLIHCLIVKWQNDWFHGKLSGHVRSPLVNTRQQQRPYLLSKDVVRACLLPRPQWFCRWRQPQKIALWLVSSVMPVPCQKKKLNHYSLFYDVVTFDVDRNV